MVVLYVIFQIMWIIVVVWFVVYVLSTLNTLKQQNIYLASEITKINFQLNNHK
jgi:uncharacterized membrane protein